MNANTLLHLALCMAIFVNSAAAFLVQKCNPYTPSAWMRHSRDTRIPRQMVPDASSIMTAVEVFDGSSIVDPVVVSDVFWSSLKGKIFAVLIGQVLATVVFGLLSWFLSKQISQLAGSVRGAILKDKIDEPRPFIRADEMRPPPDFRKLLICLVIDVLGSSSEIVPFLGEVTDVVYAPIAATILRNLYGSNVVFGLEFAEEILPFTDILPLATICWVVDTYFPQSDVAKLLQLGLYNPNSLSEGAIDTSAEIYEATGKHKDKFDK